MATTARVTARFSAHRQDGARASALFAAALGCPTVAYAFACTDATGHVINSQAGGYGVFSVYVNLQPTLSEGQNLVVDLADSIRCQNELPEEYIDWVSLRAGSAFGGALKNFTGTVQYHQNSYPFPTVAPTPDISNRASVFASWPVRLYLTPVSAAGGVVILQGEKIAQLNMFKYSTNPRTGQRNGTQDSFVWNIYANNRVVVPTGGCDSDVRDVNITLPDYPAPPTAVPLTIRCARPQHLAYFLTGTTVDPERTIFTNTAAPLAASG